MMYRFLHYFVLIKYAQFALQKLIEFFSRSVEVYTRTDTGRRFVCGKFGIGMVLLHATCMLLMGVILLKPLDLAEQFLAYEPSLDDARRLVDATQPGPIDYREAAQETIDKLQNSYVTDEAVRRGSYYTGLVYEAAFQTVTVPFGLFVAGYVVLGAFLHTRAQAGDEVNDWHGVSRLDGLLPGVSGDRLTGVAEPLLVIFLAGCCWAQLPGSQVRMPWGDDIDPVLGRFLLASGVCLAIKEGLRQTKERQKAENLESQQRKAGLDPLTGADEEHAFSLVEVVTETPAPMPTVASAYAALPRALLDILTDLPEQALPPPPRPAASGPDEAEPARGMGVADAPPRPKAYRIRCPKCGAGYKLASIPDGKIECAKCFTKFCLHPKQGSSRSGRSTPLPQGHDNRA